MLRSETAKTKYYREKQRERERQRDRRLNTMNLRVTKRDFREREDVS